MSKISDLSSVLMDKFKLSQQDAEAFVATMFEVIKDSLEQGEKSVKIKKLGTFKVTSVSSRESININTGERILIEARNKISFVPEMSLKDRVNKPFSQFETVLINDGIDFTDIEEEPLEIAEEQEIAPVKEVISKDTKEPIIEEKQEDDIPTDNNIQSNEDEHDSIETLKEEFKGKLKTRNIIITILTIALFIILGAGIYGFKKYNTDLQKKTDRILELEIIMDNQQSQKALNDTLEQNKKDSLNTQKPAIDTLKSEQYNKDPRIRTGAYVITGIAETVIVQRGQTLHSISRAILGEGMECYVEAVNEKRNYKEGETVNIPALKLKAKRVRR